MGADNKGRAAVQGYAIAQQEIRRALEDLEDAAERKFRESAVAWAYLVEHGPTEVELLTGTRLRLSIGHHGIAVETL